LSTHGVALFIGGPVGTPAQTTLTVGSMAACSRNVIDFDPLLCDRSGSLAMANKLVYQLVWKLISILFYKLVYKIIYKLVYSTGTSL